MATVTVEKFKSFEWNEVWKVTSYRDGLAFDRVSTGRYIHNENILTLPEGYRVSSISTSLLDTPGDTITLELW